MDDNPIAEHISQLERTPLQHTQAAGKQPLMGDRIMRRKNDTTAVHFSEQEGEETEREILWELDVDNVTSPGKSELPLKVCQEKAKVSSNTVEETARFRTALC